MSRVFMVLDYTRTQIIPLHMYSVALYVVLLEYWRQYSVVSIGTPAMDRNKSTDHTRAHFGFNKRAIPCDTVSESSLQ